MSSAISHKSGDITFTRDAMWNVGLILITNIAQCNSQVKFNNCWSLTFYLYIIAKIISVHFTPYIHQISKCTQKLVTGTCHECSQDYFFWSIYYFILRLIQWQHQDFQMGGGGGQGDIWGSKSEYYIVNPVLTEQTKLGGKGSRGGGGEITNPMPPGTATRFITQLSSYGQQ